MEYRKHLVQYEILNNDGTGPFKKEVTHVFILYNEGKPVQAVLGIDAACVEQLVGLSEFIDHTTFKKPELEKIVEFFDKK